MEDVSGLKDTIERIEKRLISASKIYSAIYWILALTVFGFASNKILGRLKALLKSYGKDVKPKQLSLASAIGFMSFISISVFGMFLSLLYFAESIEKEMIPAFLIPAISILFVGRVAIESIIYAGFSIALGYSLTTLAYLYTAFKGIE